MKNKTILSHWGQELDHKIAQAEESIANSKKKRGDTIYNEAHVNIEIDQGIKSLEDLKRQKALYYPSQIIGQIDNLHDEIFQKSNEFEQLIGAAKTKVERISQQISAKQIKLDIAKQFNGKTEDDQELEKMTQEMANANDKLKELQRQYKIFIVAKNHQNDACMVSKDTPGYRLRSLHNQLIKETDTFKSDIESEVNALYEGIDNAVNNIVKAAQMIGELSITAKIRDLELKASGFTETGLRDKLKSIQLKSDLKHRTLQQIVDAKRFID